MKIAGWMVVLNSNKAMATDLEETGGRGEARNYMGWRVYEKKEDAEASAVLTREAGDDEVNVVEVTINLN